MLVAIVIVCGVRPLIGDFGAGPSLFSIAMLGLLLVAVLIVQVDDLVGEREVLVAQRRRRKRIALALAVPAVVERLYMLVAPSPQMVLLGSIAWLVFFSFVTWNQLRTLLKHKAVTTETISMSISIYLLLGLTWGIFYVMLFQLDPRAFNLGASSHITDIAANNDGVIFPILTYFSLTTISTVGFGDITPLTLQARYAAVAEGITGQFYLAILVARLVGMHMSTSVVEDTRK